MRYADSTAELLSLEKVIKNGHDDNVCHIDVELPWCNLLETLFAYLNALFIKIVF